MSHPKQPVDLRESVRALARTRLSKIRPDAAPRFLDENFPAQSAFITDPGRMKVVLCTRRSGKSYGAGLYLYKEAYEQAGVSCLYLALTRDSAKKIMWKDVLKPISRQLMLNARFNETELTATLTNDSVLYLLGVDSAEEEKKKLLGQKYKLVVIDEAASFSVDLNELVYGVLKPSVADYRGTICLIGTPGNVKRGLFFDLTQGQDPSAAGTWERQGFSGHRWSTFDNPFMRAQWTEEIAELKAANPRIEDTPLFQQHYMGRWVVDDSKLVYRYLVGRNDFDGTLPHPAGGHWHYVLGIDLGYNDPTALVVCAWHEHDRTLYVLEAGQESGLDVTAVAQRIRALEKRFEFDAMVIDNANKQAVEELRRRHDLALTPADKTGKSDFIEIMNGEFIQGHIKLGPQARELAEQYGTLVWNERSEKREEHPGCRNDLADAATYAWRRCYQYLSEAPVRPPTPGTAEWNAQIEEELLQVAMRDAMRRHADPLDPDTSWLWEEY